MVRSFGILLVFLSLAFSTNLEAKVKWSDYRLTYLKGNNYLIGDNEREVWTFEYAAGTDWGDAFMFFDRLTSADGTTSTYGEFSPRIKLKSFDGFVKNVYFAPSVEMGPQNNYLWGVGTDLAIPGFNFFQFNVYLRDNGVGENSMQTTLAWAIPLGPLMYDGFIDFATGVDQTGTDGTRFKSSDQMNFTSQLKYDIGPFLNLQNKLYVGIEYVFWNNKFGIKDTASRNTNERNVNLLLKFHF